MLLATRAIRRLDSKLTFVDQQDALTAIDVC